MEGLSEDKIEGVRAIADFLGWPGKAGERRVYHVRERGLGPIRKREGIGYYAFRSELTEWLKSKDTLGSDRAA